MVEFFVVLIKLVGLGLRLNLGSFNLNFKFILESGLLFERLKFLVLLKLLEKVLVKDIWFEDVMIFLKLF